MEFLWGLNVKIGVKVFEKVESYLSVSYYYKYHIIILSINLELFFTPTIKILDQV